MSQEIKSSYVATPRLTHYVLESGPEAGIPVIFIHDNIASSVFYKRIMSQMPEIYHCYAYDQRNYGRSSAVPVDATLGLKEFADDLHSLIETLNIPKAHLVGWSLGGAVIMKYALEHSSHILSIILEAPIGPYGCYGTKDLNGTLNFPDNAGSGVMPSAQLAQIIENRDINLMTFIFQNCMCKPGNRISAELEEEYLNEFFLTKIGEDYIPGDAKISENWPGWCPGDRGVYNAFSGKYHNVEGIKDILEKPRILWIRGEEDMIISDNPMSDPGIDGASGKLKDYPGEEVYPRQPMVGQMRNVLEKYKENGGVYEEVVISDCGHSPQIEKEDEFMRVLMDFLNSL